MTLWTIVHQAPLSIRFSRQEYWSGLPFPSSGDLSDPAIKPSSPALQGDSLPSELPGKPLNWPKFSVDVTMCILGGKKLQGLQTLQNLKRLRINAVLLKRNPRAKKLLKSFIWTCTIL